MYYFELSNYWEVSKVHDFIEEVYWNCLQISNYNLLQLLRIEENLSWRINSYQLSSGAKSS